MGVALYAFPTKSWRSLLALSTQVPGVFTGGVVVLCHVSLWGQGDTQGQVLHRADLRLLQLLRWSIEPVLNPTIIFRERSVNQGGRETQIFKNYQSNFPLSNHQLSSVNNSRPYSSRVIKLRRSSLMFCSHVDSVYGGGQRS